MKDAPIRKNTLALCSTKSNSVLPLISLVPFAVCNDFDLRCWNSSNKLGSSFSGLPTSMAWFGDQDEATSVIGD